MRVLNEPKNSLVAQYKALFNMEQVCVCACVFLSSHSSLCPFFFADLLTYVEQVDLELTDTALHAVAKKAIEKKTGARGLRALLVV